MCAVNFSANVHLASCCEENPSCWRGWARWRCFPSLQLKGRGCLLKGELFFTCSPGFPHQWITTLKNKPLRTTSAPAPSPPVPAVGGLQSRWRCRPRDLQHRVAGVTSRGHIPKGKHELTRVPLAWHHAEHPMHAVSSAVCARVSAPVSEQLPGRAVLGGRGPSHILEPLVGPGACRRSAQPGWLWLRDPLLSWISSFS